MQAQNLFEFVTLSAIELRNSVKCMCFLQTDAVKEETLERQPAFGGVLVGMKCIFCIQTCTFHYHIKNLVSSLVSLIHNWVL